MEPELGLNENFSNEDNNTHQKKTSNAVRLTQNKSNSSLISNVDLTNIEASEESLKPYTLTRQFLKMDLDRIRELIEILEEYCISLVEKEDLKLAKAAKQRLILLKKIEKEKMMIEAKIIYSNQLGLVEDKMKEELDAYILNSEEKFEDLMSRFKEQENEMEKLNKEEIDEYKANFEQTYNQMKPKPSKECLNWMKIRTYALKQNKFNKAQEAEKEIEKLNKKDNMKFNKNKAQKLNIEINKIKKRQNNEKKVYEMKKNSMIIEFNESKQKGIDTIKKKYTSKISELKNYQNFEISNFDKITKGVIKPCSRIQSIVSSATGIKDEDEKNDEEENENENKEEKEENENKEEKENNNEEENKDSNDKKEEKLEEEKNENDKDDKDKEVNLVNEEKEEKEDDEEKNEEKEEEEKEDEDNGEEYINKED